MVLPEKKWEILPWEKEAHDNDFPAIISSLLFQRGINSSEEIERFLYPSLDQLPLPEGMLGLTEAVGILEDALEDNAPIVIYGDYDADGITSSAVLYLFLKEIGFSVTSYIPDRIQEGYGLHEDALNRLRSIPEIANRENPVLVTVDCGISSHSEVLKARELGFRIIITDHHQPPADGIPCADAVINPHQRNCSFPYRDLAGVGVAFYLIAGLRSRLSENGFWRTGSQPNLKKYLDLVAIGSVADMVPLTGANRVLVKAGLEVMREEPRPGILSLMNLAGISAEGLDSAAIAFLLAPRVNAAGRVGDPQLALELLMADDRNESERLAGKLEQDNMLRKKLAEEIFQEASLQASDQIEEGSNALILVGEDWHHGVIGIVASRIANIHYRPTVVMSCDEDGGIRGSIRSIEDLNILEILDKECAIFLEGYGGHKAAAGLSLKKENLNKFTKKFKSSVNSIIGDKDITPSICLNYKAPIDKLFSVEFLDYYQKLEPFGKGNPEPLFGIDGDDAKIFDARKIGSDSLRFRIKQNGNSYNGVAFGMAHMLTAIQQGPVDLAFRIVRNDFRGALNWEIRVEDIKAFS